MVLCDIGNTTLHFKKGKKHYKVFYKKNDSKFPSFGNEQIYFISVSEKGTKKLLKHFKNAIDLRTIINFSTTYKGLGIDRQVVCSGIENGIVVDAGSAVTVDIMKNGNHKGGFILPGLESYRKIYPKISKKLSFDFKNEPNLDKMATDTNSAINYAIFSSILDPILLQQKKYNLQVIFTGGDGKILWKNYPNKKKKYKKELIFENMKKLIKGKLC